MHNAIQKCDQSNDRASASSFDDLLQQVMFYGMFEISGGSIVYMVRTFTMRASDWLTARGPHVVDARQIDLHETAALARFMRFLAHHVAASIMIYH